MKRGCSHILIGGAIRHGDIVWVIVQRVDVQPVVLGTSGQFSQQVRDVLLFGDGQVVLRGPEEDDAAFTDGDGQVANLILRVGGVENVLEFGRRVLATDDGSHVDVLEVVDRPRVLERGAS